jgi:hypothetical protein
MDPVNQQPSSTAATPARISARRAVGSPSDSRSGKPFTRGKCNCRQCGCPAIGTRVSDSGLRRLRASSSASTSLAWPVRPSSATGHRAALRVVFDRLVNRRVGVLDPASSLKGVNKHVSEGKTPGSASNRGASSWRRRTPGMWWAHPAGRSSPRWHIPAAGLGRWPSSGSECFRDGVAVARLATIGGVTIPFVSADARGTESVVRSAATRDARGMRHDHQL